MNAMTLKRLQHDIDEKIAEAARQYGLATKDVEPIYDGVSDEAGYLSSKLKVAWVLKEPYDDVDENGKPCGGGFSITKDCFADRDDEWFKSSNGQDLVRANQTWQRIVFVMYGYRNGLTYAEMDYPRDNRRMFDVLMTTGWVNLSKMPAYTSSSDSLVKLNYLRYWREIVQRQIEILDPDVLIFGKTFDIYKSGLTDDSGIVDVGDGDKAGWVKHHKMGKRHLLQTYHPGRKSGDYIDALIRMLKRIETEREC